VKADPDSVGQIVAAALKLLKYFPDAQSANFLIYSNRRAVAKGIRVVALSCEPWQHTEPEEPAPLPEEWPWLRGMLPD
jgi:hypothetical protein